MSTLTPKDRVSPAQPVVPTPLARQSTAEAPPPHANQTGTPLGATSPAPSPQTAISFRINTYVPARKC
jgi:hypothetical protein